MEQDNWVDFRAIKQSVGMEMVLQHYGITKLRKSGDELRGRCPIHKGEGQDTFHVSVVKNAFHCFSCKARGNVLDFVAAMESCSVRGAALRLKDWFSISMPEASSDSPTQKAVTTAPANHVRAGESTIENKPLRFALKGIDHQHSYLQSRGIGIRLAEDFGIGFFSGKGSMHGRIVIPIHDEHGVLLAYAGRAVDDNEPKYQLPVGFHKSHVLYNLHRSLMRQGEKVTTVVLVEGFFDCMRVHEAGYPCVALMGCSLSKQQEKLLCDNFTGVVVLLDGDEAGRQGTEECLLRLGRNIWVRAARLELGAQPDDLSAAELSALLP